MPAATNTPREWSARLAAIVQPSDGIVVSSDRRTARLLSTVLALLVPMALLSMVLQSVAEPELDGTSMALALAIAAIFGAYLLSRTRHFRLAGAITTLIPTAAGVGVLVAVNDDPGWFAFMGLNPALGALFVPLRWAVLLASVNLGVVFGGVLATPSLDADTAIVAIMFNTIISIVLLTAAAFRNLLEQDRRADLLERQRLQQSILDGTFGGMALIRDGVITDANRTFAELVAQPPAALAGARLDELFDDETARAFDEAIRGAADAPVEIAIDRPNGGRADVEIVVRRIDGVGGDRGGVVLAMRDITDRKLADGALLRAQRMEAVGRLAAGLAHDTGNELLVMSALTERLKLEAREPVVVDTVEQLAAATNRVNGMIRRVLLVGRDEQPVPDDIDVEAFIERNAPMWRQVLGDRIELRLDGQGGGRVRLPRASFEQLFLNLVLNARDALPTGGSVTLRTSTLIVPDEPTAPEGLAAGAYQRLTVADDGVGIPDEYLARVFDPFFTTKEHGRGTGLGLFTSRSVVRQAGGEMTVSSDAGGTVVSVWVPLHDPVDLG